MNLSEKLRFLGVAENILLIKQSKINYHCLMQAQKQFKEATAFYYEGKHLQALKALTHCIQLNPTNSIYYSNRGLLLYQINHKIEAFRDIEKAQQLNPLNYIVYFNLFSIQLRENDAKGALKTLECCMSCLRLIRGRMKKSRVEVQRALDLCGNNFDALVLLVLMEMQSQNYKGALECISKYQKYQINEHLILGMKDLLVRMINGYSFSLEEQFYELLQISKIKRERFISSSLVIDSLTQNELQDDISQKIQQFNHIYAEINLQLGSVTHMIPKPLECFAMVGSSPLPIFNLSNFFGRTQMVASH